MSSAPTAADIAADARWLAQALDPDAGLVRLVEMSRAAYRAASFLDDRMLQPGVRSVLHPWRAVTEALESGARSDARWIFHIGHVGSTLIARLLGEIDGVLSIREPRILRDLTFFPREVRDRYSALTRALLSRTFAADETALVKATSFVSEIAAELVPEDGRALFVHASPRAYIEGILAGENSRKEMAALAETRKQRMAGRISGLDDPNRSEAHLAASAWACEMTSIEAAAEAMPGAQLLWCDFDRLLDDPLAGVGRIAAFFGFEVGAEQLRPIVEGSLMTRYSKALEYEYSPSLRRELLQEAGRDHRTDIDSALAMLLRAAEKSPLLARALARASSES